jgi:hypothetical protein
VAAETVVGDNTVGTFFNPINNVLMVVGPKELHANLK